MSAQGFSSLESRLSHTGASAPFAAAAAMTQPNEALLQELGNGIGSDTREQSVVERRDIFEDGFIRSHNMAL